jgi:hypothetical protein
MAAMRVTAAGNGTGTNSRQLLSALTSGPYQIRHTHGFMLA